MQLMMLKVQEGHGIIEKAALVWRGKAILLEMLNKTFDHMWAESVIELLDSGQWDKLAAWYKDEGKKQLDYVNAISIQPNNIVPLYYSPYAVWGVGANYWKKAEQMSITPPDGEPICFLKPASSLIGHGDEILIPNISKDVTAEAEIGIVIGKKCKGVAEEDAWDVIAGITPTLDMTAQDVHARNPRFLGKSKVCDTFFSFGPSIITLDEVESLQNLTIETVHNDKVVHRSTVSEMIYSIPYIVHYFSTMMTLHPGDVIMTGTPGSVPIKAGDRVGCRMGSFMELSNPVSNA